MDHRPHSKPKAAVVLILLLSVLLLLLHPTHLGSASTAFIILATCLLFGTVQVAACRLYWEEAQFLPRFAFRSALFDRPPPFLSV
jgi:lysylphosphatidylglycerol synthetase-like protein (DUF2156 family)